MKNRNALVLGSSKGIGFAISERLALNGTNLILNSRNLKNLKEAEKQLRVHNVEISLMVGDLSDENIADKINQHLKENNAKVDYLIVNSGGPPMGRVDELNTDDWQAAIQQNLLGGIYVVKDLVGNMVKQKFGRIVFISSTAAFEPSPEMILSSTARAGVSSFAKAFAAQYAAENITCNVICPGGVATEIEFFDNELQPKDKTGAKRKSKTIF